MLKIPEVNIIFGRSKYVKKEIILLVECTSQKEEFSWVGDRL